MSKTKLHQVIIKPNDNRDAFAVKAAENMVHPDEWEKFKDLIAESLRKAKSYNVRIKDASRSTLLPDRCHDTIMVSGVRGSGKTTFMLSALHYIEDSMEDRQGVSISGIEPLGIIDPTLIEDKVHIFVNIISLVKQKVEKKALKSNCFTRDDNSLSGSYGQWQKSFKGLAEGLPCIKDVGADGFSGDDWLDSEFVMEKGVQRAHAANTLEKNFHNFIHQSLAFLKKDAFILCFDDIDTKFEKGEPLLDTLHKYLTTPQLITVISGDPQLYSTLVRRKQWDNFSDKQLDQEKRLNRTNFFEGIVNQLEQQYLLKLLKPERRLSLNSLYEKHRLKDRYEIIIELDENYEGQTKQSLADFYDRNLKMIGISTPESWRRFLLSLPIRTQQQLIYEFSNKTSQEQVQKSISQIFWSDLAAKNVDIYLLSNAPQLIVINALRYLIDNEILTEGYSFTPVFSNQMSNGSQFALGACLTSAIKTDSSLIFDYWVRIGISRELLGLLPAIEESKIKAPSLRNFISHCAVYEDRPARYVARLAVSYMRATKGFRTFKATGKKDDYREKPWHGTLPLFGLEEKRKGALSPNETRIDEAIKGLKSSDRLAAIMASLPLSGATDHKGQTVPIYSLYSLLGVIGELVQTIQNTEADRCTTTVISVLKRNSQFREYPLPQWMSDLSTPELSGNSAEHEDPVETIEKNENILENSFVSSLIEWGRKGTRIKASPELLGKSFTRFFYTMNHMDDRLSSENRLGQWMHRIVVAFLNSIVVVEALEKSELNNISIELTNPVTADKNFINNLKNINLNKAHDRLSFSKWMLACPVWQFYLSNSIENLDTFIDYDEFTNNRTNLSIKRRASLTEILDKVLIRGLDKSVSLKRFRVGNKECLDHAVQVFKDQGYSKDEIMTAENNTSDQKKLITILQQKLKAEYAADSIIISTIRSLITRAKKGEITW